MGIRHRAGHAPARLDAPATRRSSCRRGDQAAGAADSDTPDRMSEGAAIVSTFYQEVGIEESVDGAVDYDELRELAAAEQLEKWGLA